MSRTIAPTHSNECVRLRERNNIIKLQSLIHNQLSSPYYSFKYLFKTFRNYFIIKLRLEIFLT
ncbi:hypothetical protein ALC53_12184 [Atta colombica]|uniref:Uncharacterized protein n=1 Tax=Atta colombica TaxID=520822 RepID=A0A195AYS9_9HYME|nr:hypothetical protein ALC53_12184 [Atta colombica]